MRRSPAGASSASSGMQAALLVEEFLRPVAAQPLFQHCEMFGMRGRVGERHLMRAERSFDLPAIDHLGPVQPFGDRSTIIGQRGAFESPWTRAFSWISLICFHRFVERRGHRLVHERRFVALDKNGCPAIAAQRVGPVPRG